jgi:hypothetical protein
VVWGIGAAFASLACLDDQVRQYGLDDLIRIHEE